MTDEEKYEEYKRIMNSLKELVELNKFDELTFIFTMQTLLAHACRGKQPLLGLMLAEIAEIFFKSDATSSDQSASYPSVSSRLD